MAANASLEIIPEVHACFFCPAVRVEDLFLIVGSNTATKWFLAAVKKEREFIIPVGAVGAVLGSKSKDHNY